MNETKKRLKQIEIENFIWIIYIAIIFLSFYGNKFEKSYFLTNNTQDKETYRKITIIIFTIAVIIYLYFFIDGLNDYNEVRRKGNSTEINYSELSLIASTLILISGIILLYIAIKDIDITTELAFN